MTRLEIFQVQVKEREKNNVTSIYVIRTDGLLKFSMLIDFIGQVVNATRIQKISE